MTLLIAKMIFCLVVALLLGLIIGWLIAKAFSREKYEPKIKELTNTINDMDTELDEMDKNYKDQKHLTMQLSSKNKSYEDKITVTSNLLKAKEDDFSGLETKLNTAKHRLEEMDSIENHNKSLIAKVSNLEESLQTKEGEFKELGDVLEKADQRVKEKETLVKESEEKIQLLIPEQKKSAELIAQLKNEVSDKDVKLKALDDEKNKIVSIGSESKNLIKNLKNELSDKDIKLKALDDESKKLAKVIENKDQAIKSFETNIKILEEKALVQKPISEDDKYIISKDQFQKMEDQLTDYKSKVELAKSKKSHTTADSFNKYLVLGKDKFSEWNTKASEKISSLKDDMSKKEVKDAAEDIDKSEHQKSSDVLNTTKTTIFKFFRDTYSKIKKS